MIQNKFLVTALVLATLTGCSDPIPALYQSGINGTEPVQSGAQLPEDGANSVPLGLRVTMVTPARRTVVRAVVASAFQSIQANVVLAKLSTTRRLMVLHQR